MQSDVIHPASGLPVHIISKARPGAPWLLLVHGLGQEGARDWLPVLAPLSEHFQLLLLDLPGFGKSPRPDAALTPEKYASLLHWLVSQHADAPVLLAGHSLGAAIALRYSGDYPADVRRLLLIDAAGLLQVSVFARHLSLVPERIDKAPLLDRLTGIGSTIINHFSGRIQDSLAESASTVSALAGSDRARSLLYRDSSTINAAVGLVNEDFTPLLRRIRTPVWILWGERDPVAPVRTGLALQWLLPQARLDTLPGVGHVPMSEAAQQTGQWMLRSLQGPMPERDPVAADTMHEDGYCKNQDNMVFRGTWRSVTLEHCAHVRIEDASLGRLVMTRSAVVLSNVTIRSQAIAIEAKRSNLSATGLRLAGAQAFSIDNSRIDLAAVEIATSRLGQSKGGATFFTSLGRWCDGAAAWRLHGVWKLRNGEMDQQVRRVPDSRCAASGPVID